MMNFQSSISKWGDGKGVYKSPCHALELLKCAIRMCAIEKEKGSEFPGTCACLPLARRGFRRQRVDIK